jgi:diguanylate cyclase (GGDEF)-like protein
MQAVQVRARPETTPGPAESALGPAPYLDVVRQGFLVFERGRLVLCTGPARDVVGGFGLPERPSLRQALHTLCRLLPLRRDALFAQVRCALDRCEGLAFEILHAGLTLEVGIQPFGCSRGTCQGWTVTLEDVTLRRAAESAASERARLDPLTGLPNRLHLRERLEDALVEVETSDGACAVLLVDLDRFKPVNDTLGHAIGDALLAKVAERLSATLRPCDTVARIGGDEFVVVQRGVTDLEETQVLARRIVDLIGRTYMIEGQLLTIGASVGVAVAPRDGTDADRLLKCADLALYRAKLEGRGAFRFFEAEMDARMQARRRLELDIRQALGRREFSLHYQPQLNLENDRVTGCEALLRWNHPERGMVPPGEFISLAEEIGLIVPIGEWVIRQACRDAATWPSAINVAVNVSPAQFKGDRLVEVIVSALASSGLAASRLEIEITEGVLLQENERTLRTLHRLRALGIRVSMDDFGTGYSSLSYLRSFPFDKIKIDRSFVADITQKPDGDAVIRAIAGLGRSLGMTTVAEGVETEDQMRRIRAEGCTDVQGYLVSRPIPAQALLALFNDLGPHGLAQA